MALETLKRRADFVRLRDGARWSSTSFVLQADRRLTVATGADCARSEDDDIAPAARRSLEVLAPRLGLTVTKRLGNAVVRNRIRRRLREAARQIAPICTRPGRDYVLIAREAALKRCFADIVTELTVAFQRVNARLDGGERSTTRQSRRGPHKLGQPQRQTKRGQASSDGSRAADHRTDTKDDAKDDRNQDS